MRLTDHERQQIVEAARRHFGPGSRVILFGLRTPASEPETIHAVAETLGVAL